MEKNNKILIGVIVVLIIWVAVLSGFFIYDKVLDKKEPEVKEPENNNSAITPDKDTNSTTKPQIPVKEDHSVILNGGWYQDDADVIKVNYESVKNEGTVNGLHIKYECDEKEEQVCEADSPECIEKLCTNKYTINDKISFHNMKASKISGVCYEPVVLSYKDFIVVYEYGCQMIGTMKIYDKIGDLKIDKNIDLSQGTTTYYPVIHNQKLYFYEYQTVSSRILKYIDLAQSKLVEKEVDR